ncbi:MAG: hypothetical protein ACYDCQ_15860 [Dehalococcoidia bacterium]
MSTPESDRMPPVPGRDNALRTAPHGGQTRTGAEANARELPDVMPGNDPANLRATYVPDSAKPGASAEYNPGAGEYAPSPHVGPAGTEASVGATGHPAFGQRRTTNHPPSDFTPELPPSSLSQPLSSPAPTAAQRVPSGGEERGAASEV